VQDLEASTWKKPLEQVVHALSAASATAVASLVHTLQPDTQALHNLSTRRKLSTQLVQSVDVTGSAVAPSAQFPPLQPSAHLTQAVLAVDEKK